MTKHAYVAYQHCHFHTGALFHVHEGYSAGHLQSTVLTSQGNSSCTKPINSTCFAKHIGQYVSPKVSNACSEIS